MILTMVLTVLLFGGTRLMAQDLSNKPSETQTTPDEEKSKEEGSLAKTNENEEGSESADDTAKDTTEDNNGAVLPKGSDNPDPNKTATENNNENLVKEAPKTKAEEKTEANADAKPAAKEAEKPAETPDVKPADKTAAGNGPEDGAKLQAAPAKAPETQGAPAGEGTGTGTATGTEPTPAGGDKKQVDPKADKDLKDLQDQIDAAKKVNDKKKEAELQKEYNEKLLKKIEETGSDKYADETAKRITDKDQIKLYNDIREKKKELDAKLEEGTLTKDDVDEFNKLLGRLDPPRSLTPDELDAVKKLQETPYVPGIADNSTEYAKKLYDAYEKAKKALKDATDPSITKKPLAKEKLDELVNAFKKAETELREGIRNGKVNPNYAENNPEIYIYPLDSNGKAGEKLDEGTYYIPDDTGLNLLFQVNKNDEPKEFTFTIQKLEKVQNPTLPKEKLGNLVFLNEEPVELKDNGDGTYSFTTTKANKNFGIAQLKFNMPGFRAAFHEGFTLTLTGTGANEVKKTFLITKKGYEDYINLEGKGLQKDGDNKPGKKEEIPEIDAGVTEDNIVDQNTDKLHDFFVELKKNNAYIDEVLVNSANGQSLPLSSVDITITAPQNFNGDFAELIHKSGLEYHKIADGKYQLKLNLEKFNKDEDFKVEGDKLIYKGNELKNKDLTNAILESTKGKVYIDSEKKEHPVTTTTVLEGTLDKVDYQVRLDKDHKVQSLWKKDGDSYKKVGDFVEGKVTDLEGNIYEVRGNDLISYKKTHEVFEGNVSNDKEGKADPTVTPTFDGNQVRVTEKVNGEEKTSYGGTIVKDKIFQKIGEDERYLINQTDLEGKETSWVDDNGKRYNSKDEAKGLREIKNGVFKKVTKADGTEEYYIVDGLTFKPGLTLIDKFGRPMRYITVEQVTVTKKDNSKSDEYKFTKKKGETEPETVVTTKNAEGTCTVTFGGRTITVGNKDEKIFVDNTNYIVTDGHTDIIGDYYYDKDNNKFEKVDKDKVIGDKYYKGLQKTEKLKRKTIETYDKGKQIVPDKVDRYYGSLNPKDYYTIGEGTEARTYIKKGSKDNPYFESADGGKANIIAGFEGQYIVQTLGTDKDAKQIITDEDNIFDAVQNAKFAFRYPGFLAGKDILYSAKAEVKANYKDPNKNDEEVSIFKEGSKTVTRYFTLKTKEITNPSFFKHKPAEFDKDKYDGLPNYNFFNIFYRDSTDIKRDQLIKELFDKQDEVDKKKAEVDSATTDDDKKKAESEYDKTVKANKFYTDLLTVLQDELRKRFDGAKFALNGDKVEIQDKYGKVIELDRSLLWEIGFESKKADLLFPEDKDTSIVVEDYNMDNRLVYDEIIINDTEENWEKFRDSRDKVGKAQRDLENAKAEEVDAKKKALEDAKKELEDAKQAVKETKQAVEEAKIAFEKVKKAYETDNSDANKKALEEAKNTLEKAKSALKEKAEALDKLTFKGTDQYFFLDQIDNIRFGVSRGYVDGDFIAVGPGFKITKDEILGALRNKKERTDITDGEGNVIKGKDDKPIGQYLFEDGKHYIEKNGIKYQVKRDEAKGQIRIKVMNAFYKDNKDPKTDHEKDLNKFYSPTQEAYEEQRNDFIKHADEYFKAEAKGTAEETKKAFQESFKDFIVQTYDATTDCYGTLTHLFEERLKKVKVKDGDKDRAISDVVKDLKAIREAMVEAMKTMDLKYLDGEKNKSGYKFDDMRFNAIRLELKPNMVIGGAMTPQRTKKFGITSVIVPDVDIPYTDEFGNPMTNKDMYLNKLVKDILNDKKFGKDGEEDKDFEPKGWDKKEETYIKVMEEAYRRLNKEYESKIVPLVTASDEKDKYAWNKYTIKKGNELEKDDLAIDGKPLTNPSGGRINPLYILTEEKDKDGNPVKDKEGKAKTKLVKITDLVTDKTVKETLDKKYGEKPIDLIAYYMIKDGYNRPKFENSAQYKLPKQKQGPGIYGEDNNWKEKICYPGPIGKCIEMSGGDEEPPTPGKKAKGEDGFKSKADITIDYPETNDKPNEEHPGLDKKHKKSGTKNDTSVIDIDEKDQKVDFTIVVSVNQMTKTEKQIYDAETGKTSQIKDGDYSENGHYRYQDGTLIMDILPNIFKLSNNENVKLKVHSYKLISGGSFKNEDDVKKWEKGIKYQYVEDLKAYIDGLTDKKQKELLEKAYNKAVKDGEKVQAIIAWLPAFDAPTKTTDHFTFELNNVLVDKKEFKDYLGNGNGEIYTNHAIFKDNGEIYYASTDVPIKKGKEGSVDKYLRIRDKDNNIINGETAKEWFKGNAKLKFGDKFDYKLIYKANTDIQDTSRVGEKLIKVDFDDIFKTRDDKGFKPILNGFVQVEDKYKDKFIIKYQIGKESLTKEDIEAKIEADKKAGKDTKLSDIMKDVTGVSVISADGGVNAGEAPEFILPMMIPNIDAKIEGGKVVYIGKDGEKHELGAAKDFFELGKLLDKDAEMAFDNSFEDSNTVTVYLEKERFIRVFKEFLAANGEKLKNLDNLEAKFDVYQIIEENGKKTRVKLDKQLIVNKKNDFTDMIDHLPIFKKSTTVDKDGKVTVNEIKYEYELVEIPVAGFEGKVYKLDDSKGLGFVWEATNTEKPEIPPEYPKDHPKNVKVKITVNKVWKVLNGGSTPSIQVELYANGKATGKIITLGADGSWSASFEDLPSKDANGKEIIYTVREIGESNELTKIDDRTFEVIYTGNLKDGFTIINKEIPPDDEKPKDKKEPKKHKPNDEEGRDRTPKKNRIPKTGVAEDLGAIYFAFVLLLGLVFIKKRYLVK